MVTENDLATFTVRVPKKLGEEILQLAREENRSRNGQVVEMLTQYMDLVKAKKTRARPTPNRIIRGSMKTLTT